MRKEAFKKIIKEAVKEAIREELTTTLMEALLRTNNTTSTPKSLNENQQNSSFNPGDLRNNYPKPNFSKDQTLNFNTNNVPISQPYNPKPSSGMATAGEGSSLPPGEVSMDQISNLMSK